MALTKAAGYTTHGPLSYGRFTVASGVTIYPHALVDYIIGTGTVTNHDDAANGLFIGYALEKVVGDGTLQIQVQLRGDILRDVTITGVTGATQNGSPVYATDENTFTLTRPSDDAAAVGIVLDGGASNADLFLFSVKESTVLALAGGNKVQIPLGQVSTRSLEATTAANLRAGIPLWGHGKITALYAWPVGFDTDYLSGSQTLNLEIEGTNLTGGVLTLAFSSIDAAGDVPTKISATAITAANEFHDGDLLDIERISGGTAFTSPADNPHCFELFMDVEYLAGA